MAVYVCVCPCCGKKYTDDKPPGLREAIHFKYIMRTCATCGAVPVSDREKWIRAATKAYLEIELTPTDRQILAKYGRIR